MIAAGFAIIVCAFIVMSIDAPPMLLGQILYLEKRHYVYLAVGVIGFVLLITGITILLWKTVP